MPLKAAGSKMLETAGAVPGALIVGVEHVACRVHADAAGRSQAAASGNHFAIGRNAQSPAAIFHVAAERAGETERDPQVAVAVELRAKAVFVIIAGDFPAVVDDFEQIGAAV